MNCPTCNQTFQIETRESKGFPYLRIYRRICGCGIRVTTRTVIDPAKVCSSDPLPGFDRSSVIEALQLNEQNFLSDFLKEA